VPQLDPGEVKALARILDELNYYQLLHIERSDGSPQIKRGYHETFRMFHPDAHRQRDPELQDAIRCIAKRITEAYSVLRDPRRRQVYDRRLDAGNGVRMQLAEAQAEAGRAQAQRRGTTPQGRQYFDLAQLDLRRNDLAAAERNLQTALTFEPGNAGFREQLNEVRSKLR